MALAPIAQTLLIRLDGSFSQPPARITIPSGAIAPPASILNTTGTSALLGTGVIGFADPANALATRLFALGA